MNANRLLVVYAGLLSLLAAALHAGVIQEHYAEWWGYGLFFILAATAQGIYGLVLLAIPAKPSWSGPTWNRWLRVLYGAGLGGNLAILALYLVTRTVGIPWLGPEAGTVEAVGVVDVISKAVEATLMACLAVLLVLLGSSRPSPPEDGWAASHPPRQPKPDPARVRH